MKKDYFIEDNKLEEGKKRIYTFKKGNFELKTKNGTPVGYLEEGDVVYRVKLTDDNGKRVLFFRVIKFAKNKDSKTIFKADRDLFTKYFNNENKSGIDGSNDGKAKLDYGVPLLSGLGLGVVSFLMARKFNKNVLAFTIGGILIGAVGGHFIVNKGMNKSDLKTNDKK